MPPRRLRHDVMMDDDEGELSPPLDQRSRNRGRQQQQQAQAAAASSSRNSQSFFADDNNDEDREPTSSQAVGQEANLSAGESTRFVISLVRYMLFCERQKKPIKRNDVYENVFQKQHSRAFVPLFNEAKLMLQNVFGMDVVELPEKKIGEVSNPDRSQSRPKQWILVNRLKYPEMERLFNRREEVEHAGLLMIILALILLSSNQSITTKDLWKSLQHLNINPKTPHDIFGDIERIISDFVDEGYLVLLKDKNRDATNREPNDFYVWGPRSEVEFSKTPVIRFACEIAQRDDEQYFRALCKIAGIDPSQEPEGSNSTTTTTAIASTSAAAGTSATTTSPHTSRRSNRY